MHSIIIDNIIQSMPVGALAINPEGGIIIANEAVARILGYPIETLKGSGWGALFLENPANDDFNQVLMDVIWQEPINLHRSAAYAHPDGRMLHLSITSSFLRENDDIAGIVVLFDDITELHDLHRKEKSWLEEKNRLIQEKAAGLFRLSLAVAHQLRNPTAAIGGLAKLIQKKNGNESMVHDYAEQIIKCVTRLEEIVKAVEDYTAIPAASCRYFQAGDFGEEMCAYVIGLAGPQINCRCQVQPGELCADPKLLGLAVRQILKNAVENTAGGGTIELTCLRQDSDWMMEVSDNGCGIGLENLPFIFEPFFTTKVLGVGMGLCVAKKIISDHGGTIGIESLAGKGTTVRLQLPRQRL